MIDPLREFAKHLRSEGERFFFLGDDLYAATRDEVVPIGLTKQIVMSLLMAKYKPGKDR